MAMMNTLHKTKMAIVNNDTEEEGWCKVTFDLLEIAVARPSINLDLEYQNCHVYFKNGTDMIIEDEYDELVTMWETCIQARKL